MSIILFVLNHTNSLHIKLIGFKITLITSIGS